MIYGTVRMIEQDDETFLAWARDRYACVIFNLHIDHTPQAIAAAADAFRDLIDLGIAHGGCYYLTYHRWARKDQVERCYPQMSEFLALKRQHDPGRGVPEHLVSPLSRHVPALIPLCRSAGAFSPRGRLAEAGQACLANPVCNLRSAIRHPLQEAREAHMNRKTTVFLAALFTAAATAAGAQTRTADWDVSTIRGVAQDPPPPQGQTAPPSRPNRFDSFWYARLGYGGVFGDGFTGGPALGFGFRGGFDSFGIDVSFFNFQVPGSGSDIYGSSRSSLAGFFPEARGAVLPETQGQCHGLRWRRIQPWWHNRLRRVRQQHLSDELGWQRPPGRVDGRL